MLIGKEGGFVDDPVDRGGATKYGISLRFLKSEGGAGFDLDFDGDIDGQDIRQLTIDDARTLYHRCFWRALDCDTLDRPIGEMLFDQAVNGGRVAAVKMLQAAVGHVNVDGVLGPRSWRRVDAFVAEVGMVNLVDAYREQVKHRYLQIVARNPSQQRFLRGWLNRADALGRV